MSDDFVDNTDGTGNISDFADNFAENPAAGKTRAMILELYASNFSNREKIRACVLKIAVFHERHPQARR